MPITRMALAIWLTRAGRTGRETVPEAHRLHAFGVDDRLMIGPLAQELAGKMFCQSRYPRGVEERRAGRATIIRKSGCGRSASRRKTWS